MFYYNGYRENALTFSSESTSTTKGAPVKMSVEDTVKNSADGEDFIGICKYSDEIIASVIMDGYVEVPYSGTAPTLNLCSLVSNGTGGVKVSSTAKRNYKVLKVDTTKKIVGFIL